MAAPAEGFVSVENDPYRRFATRLRCSAADAECDTLFQPFDNTHVAFGAVAQDFDRGLIGRAVMRGDGL